MAEDDEIPDFETFREDVDFEDFDLDQFLNEFFEKYTIEKEGDRVHLSGEGAKFMEFLLETYTYVYDIDTGWSIEAANLVRLHNEIMEIDQKFDEVISEYADITEEDIEDIDEIDRIPIQQAYRTEISDKVFLFFTLATEVINSLTVDLIMKELIHEDRMSNNSREFIKGFSQPQREELLFRTGIIDGGLYGKIATVRDTRNDLTHDLRESVTCLNQ